MQALLNGRGSGLGAVCKCVSTARGFWRGMEGNNSFVMNLPDFLESRTELVPGLGRCPGEGNGNPVQYSCLDHPMDRGAWWATAHGVSESDTSK